MVRRVLEKSKIVCFVSNCILHICLTKVFDANMSVNASVGKETVHQLYGTRVAVLAGDFMFAQSSWYLANLENLEVIKLISQVC